MNTFTINWCDPSHDGHNMTFATTFKTKLTRDEMRQAFKQGDEEMYSITGKGLGICDIKWGEGLWCTYEDTDTPDNVVEYLIEKVSTFSGENAEYIDDLYHEALELLLLGWLRRVDKDAEITDDSIDLYIGYGFGYN